MNQLAQEIHDIFKPQLDALLKIRWTRDPHMNSVIRESMLREYGTPFRRILEEVARDEFETAREYIIRIIQDSIVETAGFVQEVQSGRNTGLMLGIRNTIRKLAEWENLLSRIETEAK